MFENNPCAVVIKRMQWQIMAGEQRDNQGI